MKMTKNEYLRSMARHATLLCCIVPLIAAVSAKAEGSYSWDGATYTKTGETVNDLQITLSQTATINGTSFSFNQFDSSSFSGDFQERLSGIAETLPNNQTWNLSRVIVEISATVASSSVSFDIANSDMSSVSSISGAGSPVIRIGSFVLDASDLKEHKSDGTETGGTLTSVWSSTPTVTQGNSNSTITYGGFKGGLSETLDSAVDTMTLSSFLGSGTVSGTADTSFSDLAVSVKGGTPFTGVTDISTSNLSSSLALTGLTLNIKYIVTPEPGTMALLLTGIPLFLVRRRKSWKK